MADPIKPGFPDLHGKTVVITGASSGIGKAAALAFADEGANLVLIARREEPLRRAAAECESRGARALAVSADVTDEDAIEHAARAAIEAFGSIDVWINNAAVTAYGRFDHVPTAAIRKIFDTNLLGTVLGARAAIRRFRETGHGVLINISSVAGRVGEGYASAYSATKFALRGLGATMRMELKDEPAIKVCTVFPASIDTPLFEHAANYSGRAVRPLEPIYPPEKVAKTLVRLARSPRREVIVGSAGRRFAITHRIAPEAAERLMGVMVEQHFRDVPVSPSDGNLFHPMEEGTEASGGWRYAEGPHRMRRVLPVAAGALGVALLGAGVVWMVQRRDSGSAASKAARRIAEAAGPGLAAAGLAARKVAQTAARRGGDKRERASWSKRFGLSGREQEEEQRGGIGEAARKFAERWMKQAA